MPGAARENDTTLCWNLVEDEEGNKRCVPEINAIASGSDNVFINSRRAAIQGCETTHPCTVIEGSKTVFINNRPAARIGDPLSCTCNGNQGNIATGSTNVFIG